MVKRSSEIIICIVVIILLITSKLIIENRLINSIKYISILNNKKQQNLSILIEVDKKQLHIINRADGSTEKSYTIATGKPSSPTPLGSFKIIEKGHWGEGFGSRWMGLDVPWGIYGIHGTNKPGSIGTNASAGCIRMRNKDIEEVYDIIENGASVVITNGDYAHFGSGYRTLRPGDRGSDVIEVQKRLAQRGYYSGTFDGIYGENMKRGLIEFLKINNMSLTDEINSTIYNALGIYLMD